MGQTAIWQLSTLLALTCHCLSPFKCIMAEVDTFCLIYGLLWVPEGLSGSQPRLLGCWEKLVRVLPYPHPRSDQPAPFVEPLKRPFGSVCGQEYCLPPVPAQEESNCMVRLVEWGETPPSPPDPFYLQLQESGPGPAVLDGYEPDQDRQWRQGSHAI